MYITLKALNIQKGDEIITPSFTFVSTINVIHLLGAKPVFVDIDPFTLNIDVSKIEKKITSKTKMIIPVHIAGLPCRMDTLYDLAKKYDLYVIDDAAHALGAYFNNKHVGFQSKASIFSFHPNKNITTIEGGMVASNDHKLLTKIRHLIFHGIEKLAWQRKKTKELVFDIHTPGYKFNMSDVQASLGLHQLDKLPFFLKQRRLLANTYEKNLEKIKSLELQECSQNIKHARNLFPVVLKTEKIGKNRETIINELKKQGILVGIVFPAAHQLSFYKKNTFSHLSSRFLAHTEYVGKNVISLPLFPALQKEDINAISKKLISILTRC